MTSETWRRLLRVLSQQGTVYGTKISSAHAHGNLKISRNHILRVYRDVPATSETKHDLSEQSHNQPDPETDEHDSYIDALDTRKRRRLRHKTAVSASFSVVGSNEEAHIPAQTDCSMPASAEIIDEGRTAADRFALLVLKAIHYLLPWNRTVQPERPSLKDTRTLSSSSRRNASTHRTTKLEEMTTPNCPLCSGPMIRRQNRVNKRSFWGCQQWPTCNETRRPWERGKGETSRARQSCWPQILPPLQHLDSTYADSWNRTVRFGRPDSLEVCANSDSRLIQAVENAGGEGLRTFFWNGYDLTTRCGRERLYFFW